MLPFDPNDYRKRVLAAVERRGGPDSSDPFELYDVPLEEADRLGDAEVARRVDEVWAFWQRQRDHPKYRVIVQLLVEEHERRSSQLLNGRMRRTLAERVLAERELRDAARYELLDAAIGRLMERHRGVPRDKVDGLVEIGMQDGLSRDESQRRIRRHRLIEPVGADAPAPVAPVANGAVGDERRRQLRALLDELGRLNDVPPPPTLLALINLEPHEARSNARVKASASALRARARELPPGRTRALLDELLVHVADLLEPGPQAVEAYLDSVADDVAEALRPRVRAAVLVEDRLVGEDHEHLIEEAQSQGLDEVRAIRVLARLAEELGAPVDPPGRSTAPAPRRSDREWEAPLRAARAALRAGRAREAARLVEEARRRAGADGSTPVRAVADEIEAVLAAAPLRWRAAVAAFEALRFAEALEHLEHLHRTAADVPNPGYGRGDLDAMLAEARAAVAEADRLVAAAPAGPEPVRAAALLAVLSVCAEHPGALEALALIPVEPPAGVVATRAGDGAVTVRWRPSPTADVEYRVTRLGADGAWRAVGRTRSTSVDDGGAPAGPLPVYAVVARQAGRSSAEARSDQAAPPPPPPPAPPPPAAAPALAAPAEVRAERRADGAVLVRWTAGAPGHVEYKVSRRRPDGGWSVVGRTHATSIEDGGVRAGAEIPVYAVVARMGADASQEALSGTPAPPPARTPPPSQPAPAPAAAPALPAVSGLAIAPSGLLRFSWPAGVTEAMVVVRADAPPERPDDPAAVAWKVTNTRYEIDGGIALPDSLARPCHVAVAACGRDGARLVVAPAFGPEAHLAVDR